MIQVIITWYIQNLVMLYGKKNQRTGIIVHCILWDNIPFMNFLFIKEEYRNKGLAKQAIIIWENEMKNQGYKMTLISTQVDEGAQHLYRKLGYIDCGGLVFNNTPFDQPMEMFFRKSFIENKFQDIFENF